MANKKFEKSVTKTNWRDFFKASKYQEWIIDLNRNTDRIELKKNDNIMYSTINADSCKNYAFQNYGIPLDKWN